MFARMGGIVKGYFRAFRHQQLSCFPIKRHFAKRGLDGMAIHYCDALFSSSMAYPENQDRLWAMTAHGIIFYSTKYVTRHFSGI